MVQMHLDRFTANALSISRRKAGEIIKRGQVLLNEESVTDPAVMVNPTLDKITVNGEYLSVNPVKLYYALYKPKGVVCTSDDPKGRPTIFNFIRKKKLNLHSVGRLDFWSEGLILLTNDGEFTNRVIHPSFKVAKAYSLKVDGLLTEKVVARLKRGVPVDNRPVRPFIIERLTPLKSNTRLDVVIFEGRNRILRRVFDILHFPVMSLTRTRIGIISLKGLKPGEYRELKKAEIDYFMEKNKDGKRKS